MGSEISYTHTCTHTHTHTHTHTAEWGEHKAGQWNLFKQKKEGAGKVGNPFETKQWNRPSYRDHERRKASDEVVPETSVSPLVRPVQEFFFCLCVYFASLIEKDCLLFLWPQTKAEKCQVRDSWEPHVFLNDQLAAVGDGKSKCKNKRDYQIQRWRRRKKRISDNAEKYFWPYSLSCWIQSVSPLAF